MSVAEVDGVTFEREVLMNDAPVVVDFYADWCGPCKATAPVVHALAETLTDEVRFVKVNVDRSPEFAQRFKVRSIPTFIRFDAGEVSSVVVGARSIAGLRKGLALSNESPARTQPRTAHRWRPRRLGSGRRTRRRRSRLRPPAPGAMRDRRWEQPPGRGSSP